MSELLYSIVLHCMIDIIYFLFKLGEEEKKTSEEDGESTEVKIWHIYPN